MSVKSCQYNPETKIITVVCSNDAVIELDYGVYLTANVSTKKRMRDNAIALIEEQGGFMIGKVKIEELDGNIIFTFISND